MIRVLIISPYPSVRAGLRALLGHDDIEIAWEGASANDILDPWPLQPDVAVVDGTSGPTIFETLAARIPALGIVVLGANASHLQAATGMAARGFLSPDANADELSAAVRAVAAGLTVVEPSLLPDLAAAPASRPALDMSNGESLTPRETEVLHLLANGLPNKTIAAQLGISEHTAKFHVSAVLAKLGAASRTEAVTLAARRGLLML